MNELMHGTAKWKNTETVALPSARLMSDKCKSHCRPRRKLCTVREGQSRAPVRSSNGVAWVPRGNISWAEHRGRGPAHHL